MKNSDESSAGNAQLISLSAYVLDITMGGDPQAGATTPIDLGVRGTLLVEKHVVYIKSFTKLWEVRFNREGGCQGQLGRHLAIYTQLTCALHPTLQCTEKIEFVATEHFWMSGIYWGLSALYLLGRLGEIDQHAMLEWVLSCIDPAIGGFGSSPRSDAHMLPTLSAIQIMALYDSLDLLDADAITRCEWLLHGAHACMNHACSAQNACACIRQALKMLCGLPWGHRNWFHPGWCRSTFITAFQGNTQNPTRTLAHALLLLLLHAGGFFPPWTI